MRKHPPFLHIIAIISSIALMLGSLFIWMYPPLPQKFPAAETQLTAVNLDPPIPLQYNDADQNRYSIEEMLKTSPFDKRRTAFIRSKPKPKVKPKTPEYKPEFIGTLGHGETQKAMIIWKPNEPAQTHTIGSQTPWGVLKSISDGELKFDKNGEVKTLSLF